MMRTSGRNETALTAESVDGPRREWRRERVSSALHLAGARYWTASVLPAVVGTTLPLWLRPQGFSFRWLGALEFLIATVLMHSGFSFLQARFEHRTTEEWSEFRLLGTALTCISLACLLGLHLSRFATGSIFVVYGLTTIFAGLLYVAPPVSFSQRAGGEIVVSMSLSLIPVLGAYLVQTGDLTRTVYLAALPIYAATGLWVWTGQMVSRSYDEEVGRETLVTVFGARFSGRVVVPAIAALLCVTLSLAVLSSSVMPLALAALLLSGVIWRIVAVSRNAYADVSQMLKVRAGAFIVHLGLCIVLAASSLGSAFR
jgi:1,4-dihydroxy-2-naphthoate octaprenyltransferase